MKSDDYLPGMEEIAENDKKPLRKILEDRGVTLQDLVEILEENIAGRSDKEALLAIHKLAHASGLRYCPLCGGSTRRQKHSMSKVLINGLKEFAQILDARGETEDKLSLAQLSRSAWDNFQKLKHWGLVRKKNPKGKSGIWILTEKGRDFLSGDISVPRIVTTFHDIVVEESPDEIKILDTDVLPYYWRYEDYRNSQTPATRDDIQKRIEAREKQNKDN